MVYWAQNISNDKEYYENQELHDNVTPFSIYIDSYFYLY